MFEPEPVTLPASVGPAAVRAIETTHLLTPGKGRISDYDFTLNPYRGCSFGCSYCFAAFFVADDLQRAEWGKWVEVKVRAAEALRHRNLRGKRIFMSSATDPYQPLEAKLELTREIVAILGDAQARLVVQTRSPLAARDVDLFKRFQFLRVNMSVTTDDDSVRKQFEPGCASIERRLEAVERIKAAGVRVAVCVCPMLPMHDPEAFGKRLTRMGVDAVTSGYFHSGDRAFAAGTRDRARELADEQGWTYEAYSRCRAALRHGCEAYGSSGAAFGPV
ncbi:Radical SAM domain-containing protein [Fimbriimonas ginsengisoli Gsoil 348]|uniref:Radical SAM domain-containing protein n=1 Tax=Fimbriimonas ginsengisoli Gsoil 348 TaxID=661478 RepID=A0A068NQL3_FIMGI|nr:Radical SAM domain-containing protein [Fimbriimonas ginsengisoli Gsoil 348]